MVLQTGPTRSRRRRAEALRHLRHLLPVHLVTYEPRVKALNFGEHLEAVAGQGCGFRGATRLPALAALGVRRVEAEGGRLHVARWLRDHVLGRRRVCLARHAAAACLGLRLSIGQQHVVLGVGQSVLIGAIDMLAFVRHVHVYKEGRDNIENNGAVSCSPSI